MADPAAEFYYTREGRETSWYQLDEATRAEWRRKYERARREAKKTLAKIRANGRGLG